MMDANLSGFTAHISKIQEAISEARLGAVVRGRVIRVFKKIVRETPQWSGAAASVWNINFGGGVGSIRSGFSVTKAPFSKGDEPAVSAAFMKSAWVNSVDAQFLGGCSISNPQSYIDELESGSLKGLRALNTPGRMVQRALAENSKRERLSLALHFLAEEKL